MEQTVKEVTSEHFLSYSEKETKIGGVKKVENFGSKEIILLLNNGVLHIFGSDFSLNDMTSSTKTVSFSGKIRSLEYKEKSEPSSLFKKMFK